jgi:hypothetical protein
VTADLLARQAQSAAADVRQRTTAAARLTWLSLPDYSDEGLAIWLSQVVPLVSASQQVIATLTDIYIAGVLSEMSGQHVSPIGIPAETASGPGVRNGLPMEDEYARPFKEIWFQLSQDKDFAQAVGIGEQRAMSMIATDLQLARTHSARYALTRSGPALGIVGYRRIITSAKACQLCQIASTQRYHIAELMPIHNNCSCGVAPINAEKDPGQRIDKAFIHPDAEASDASGKFAPYYAHPGSVIFPGLEVRQHGEIGPVLTVKGQAFRGPDDIPPAAETGA